MPDDLREKVAKAIIESQCGTVPESIRESCTPPFRGCRRSADAALTAIREAGGPYLRYAADKCGDPQTARFLRALAGEASDAG